MKYIKPKLRTLWNRLKLFGTFGLNENHRNNCLVFTEHYLVF